jgi:hypothetical protein
MKTKTKINKKTPRKQKTKQSKTKQSKTKTKQSKTKTKQLKNNNQEPKSNKVVMYSRNQKTGYQTVVEAEKIENDGGKALMVKSESVLPPTVITQNGPNYSSTSMISMAQKRQMVVKSYH